MYQILSFWVIADMSNCSLICFDYVDLCDIRKKNCLHNTIAEREKEDRHNESEGRERRIDRKEKRKTSQRQKMKWTAHNIECGRVCHVDVRTLLLLLRMNHRYSMLLLSKQPQTYTMKDKYR